ncbi:hypothetical protein BST97_06815 [Nonlabens spongiae]|uniref:Alpha-mannosidase n=1 Tax=Nonlabens spongiae TaxID=331648 RepID=A0A1W6MJE1_9FLAO|nr:alpha/beta hydrolase-fold protein [Nonlabens spongiae]ARN77731.1 hypothetical protein BST97_06815 [Nonlabens spongiae]
MKIKRLVLLFCFLICLSNLSPAQEVVVDSLNYNGTPRKIRIYLPSQNIDFSKSKIIYMLDAQNLFDDETSYAGEWEVDEAIDNNINVNQKPVVVGIDHGNAERINELTPYAHKKYGGGKAEEFLVFLINEVMPHIERKFQFQHSRINTVIAGSSLGGLFAHYALFSEPKVFSAAGVFSPSYWFSDKIYRLSKDTIITLPTFIYLSGGDSESEKLVQEMRSMQSLLDTKENMTTKITIIPGGEHNEKQWRESFPSFLETLEIKN